MAKLIDGAKAAAALRASVKQEVAELKARGVEPALASVLVGGSAASKLYLKLKAKACREVGILNVRHDLPASASTGDVRSLLTQLNMDSDVHGILVQLPLPKAVDRNSILSAVDPRKDVDGFHPSNLGRLALGDETMPPATPKGIVKLLEAETKLKGKEAVIVNHSIVVGRPLALMLLNRDATVRVCHVHTKDLTAHTSSADVLITAVGKKNLITAAMVKKGAIVIDAGVAKTKDGIVGDVDFAAVSKKAKAITPVPGGVGPMTVASLLENTVAAAKKQSN